MPFGNRKKYFGDLFSSVLSQFKKKIKNHPSENLKFNDLAFSKASNLRTLMEKSFQYLFN